MTMTNGGAGYGYGYGYGADDAGEAMEEETANDARDSESSSEGESDEEVYGALPSSSSQPSLATRWHTRKCTVLIYEQKFSVEDAIGSHA
jgi:hypothetical protein